MVSIAVIEMENLNKEEENEKVYSCDHMEKEDFSQQGRAGGKGMK